MFGVGGSGGAGGQDLIYFRYATKKSNPANRNKNTTVEKSVKTKLYDTA